MTVAAHAFRADGTLIDLARLREEDIDFAAMANALSKIARFNGIYRCTALSVAQHSVMGADALYNETGDAVLAGYFVLHDGHEYLIGDHTRPSVAFIAQTLERLLPGGAFALRQAYETGKAALDTIIHAASGMPPIAAMPLYRRKVAEMDDRMLRAEAIALFGAHAATELPAADLSPPRLTGAIRPWGAMKAEEAFVNRLERYCGIVVRVS